MILQKSTPDYNGQPRSADGRFARGKQKRGSRTKGRNLGAQAQTAGLYSLPPYHAPRPKRRPGEKGTPS